MRPVFFLCRKDTATLPSEFVATHGNVSPSSAKLPIIIGVDQDMPLLVDLTNLIRGVDEN